MYVNYPTNKLAKLESENDELQSKIQSNARQIERNEREEAARIVILKEVRFPPSLFPIFIFNECVAARSAMVFITSGRHTRVGTSHSRNINNKICAMKAFEVSSTLHTTLDDLPDDLTYS